MKTVRPKPVKPADLAIWQSGRRRGQRHGRDDDDRLRLGVVVGKAQVNLGLHSRRGYRPQPVQRPARELHGRLARRQVDDTEVAPEDAGGKAGAQSLGAGFLGGETLGIARRPVGAAVGLPPLGLGEDPVEKLVAEALDRPLDAAYVDDIAPDPQDHACPSPALVLLFAPRRGGEGGTRHVRFT
jgi:hypothetical protein